MHPIPGESDIPGVVGRRSTRLSIIVPVTLRGTDVSGQCFKENTWTISVNKHGGRIASFHLLAADDQIIVENPLQGQTAKARVSRVCEKRFPEDPYEVCFELLEAQNLWGVKLPPEDWLKERQATPGEEDRTSPQVAPQTQETSPATAEKGEKVEISGPAPRGSAPEAGENTGGLSQFNLAVNALSRFAGEAGARLAQTASPRQEATGIPKTPAMDLLGFKFLQEKIDEAQSLRQEMSALVDRMQSARAEVESLLLKAREVRQDRGSEAARAAKQIEEVGGEKLGPVLSRLHQEIEQRLASASARCVGETEQRLQAGAVSIVESVTKELSARLPPLAQESLSKAVLEFQVECKRVAREARAELDALVKEAVAAAEAGIRKATEGIPPSLSAHMERAAEEVGRQQLEAFKAQIESARQSGEDSIRHSLEGMRQEIQADALKAGIHARKICKEESVTAAKAISVCVDSAVDALNRAGDEAAAKLQAAHQTLGLGLKKAAEECLPRLADESASMLEKFRAQAQALGAQLQSEVESAARECSEKAGREISAKLEGAVEGALEVAVRELNQQGEKALDLLKERLRSALEQCVEETQKHLAAARQSTLTSLESEAGAMSASFREQLHATLLEMRGQQTQEIETAIQSSLQGLLESLRTKIQLTADESAARVRAEIRSGAEALQELPDRLYKGVGMAALVAREWEEQAKTHLEAHSHQLLEVFQKHLEALTTAAQERQRSDAEALRTLFQARLNQAARLFEGMATDAGQAKESAREESANSPAQSLQPSQDTPQAVLEPLTEKQRQIIEELLSTFRFRLNQILAGSTRKE